VSAGTVTPYRSGQRPGPERFGHVLRAEWTKFRTVWGWLAGLGIAALVTILLGLFAAGSANIACSRGPGTPTLTGRACLLRIPTGPGGEPVNDSYYFVHRPLARNGTLTVRITSLTGRYGAGNAAPGQPPRLTSTGLEAWSKAGIIITAGTRPGSAYAAMMLTGSNGTRMQYNYTQDVAGRPGPVSPASPRWLRLARSGDTVTGYESADGRSWHKVGTAHLAGLPATVQAGLFAASPEHEGVTTSFGGTSSEGGPSEATAVFDHLSMPGAPPGAAWAGQTVAGSMLPGTFHQAGGMFTVTGSGDIAPLVDAPGQTIEQHLVGTFAGLIAVAVVGAAYVTGEYRRGLIRTTLAASPRRGRVLAAKAIVVAAATFVAGLAAAAVTVIAGVRLANGKGLFVFPVTWLTEVRVVAGTAALMAVAAVFALAVGSMLRRSTAAVSAVVVAIVLPYILGVASVLPAGTAQWLLRLTPAAAFAIQQSVPQYHQVAHDYTPGQGFFPLAPWAGFAVLCGYAAVALVAALYLLRRRDA
jgi:ABC-type transport system involved in multi-copper enzyme maturation permease subunit/regulation of enolase protein 1 (concanavalin A-like superfamily)